MISDSRLAQLIEFLADDPNDVFINYALGMEYLSLNNTTQAAHYFKKTLLLNADYIAAYYQLGKLSETIDVEKAKHYYEQGMAVAKNLNKPKDLMELKEALQWL